MKAKLLSLITLLLFAVGAKAAEPALKFSPVATDGTAQYLYNVETGTFVFGANDWGTRASVSTALGLEFKVVANTDGTYRLANNAKSGATVDIDGNGDAWVDGNGSRSGFDPKFTLKAGADNTYTISNADGSFGAWGVIPGLANNRIFFQAKNAAATATTWAFINKSDYEAYMAELYGKQRLEAANGFMGGDVLILNVETGLYVGAANDWGTKASALKHADFMTVNRLADGLYNIDSHVSNGGNHFLGTNGYVDSPEADYVITYDKATKAYTIAAPDGKLLNNTADNRVNFDGTSKGPRTLWYLITKADLKNSMKAASATNPVDVTSLVAGANFGRNNQYVESAWTVGGNCTNKNLHGGANENMCAESFHSTFDISQKLFDMPKGTYMVKVQGFYRQDGTSDSPAIFYANEAKAAFPNVVSEGTKESDANHTTLKDGVYIPNSMAHASDIFSKGGYTVTLPYAVVDDNGMLEIGVRNEGNKELWCIWDNFEIYYLGAEEIPSYPFYNKVMLASIEGAPVKKTLWTNDGTTSSFRFCKVGTNGNPADGITSDREISAEDWAMIKDGKLTINYEGNNPAISTGWWSDNYAGESVYGTDLITGEKYVTIQLSTSAGLYNSVDEKHLFFQPNGCTVKSLSVELPSYGQTVEGVTIDPSKDKTLYLTFAPNATADDALDYSTFDVEGSVMGPNGVCRTFSAAGVDAAKGVAIDIAGLDPMEYTNYTVEITKLVFGGVEYPTAKDIEDYNKLGQKPILSFFDFAVKSPEKIGYEVAAQFVEAQKQLNVIFYTYGAEFTYERDAEGNFVEKAVEPRKVDAVEISTKGAIMIDGEDIDLGYASVKGNVITIDLSNYEIEDGEHVLTFAPNTFITSNKSAKTTYQYAFETTFGCSGLTTPVVKEFEGKRFALTPGGGCHMPVLDAAPRTFTFNSQWSNTTPNKANFTSDEYSKIVVEFAEPLEFEFNTPYKDANGGQQWHTGSGMHIGNTEWTVDVAQLGVINEMNIQNVQASGTVASFTIVNAYAEKLNGTKENIVFNAPGWGGSMTVQAPNVYSGLCELSSQWGGVNVSDDIIGLPGKKVLRIYSNSSLKDVNIQWCCKDVDGKDFWPQIGISEEDDHYAECVIEETLQSIYLQHTVGDAQSIDVKAITWEIQGEGAAEFEVALVNGEENYTLNTHASVSVEKIDGLTVTFPEANVASASYDIVPLYYVENAEGGEWVPAMPQAIVGDFTIAKNVASASLNSTATLMQGTKYQVDVFVTFKNGEDAKQTYTVDGATVDDTKSAADVLGNPEIAMDADKLTITFSGAGIAEVEGASLASAGVIINAAGVDYFGNADEAYAENGKIVLSLNLAATMNMADFSPYTYKAGDELTITVKEPEIYANHADGSWDKVAAGDDIVAKYTTTAAAGLDLDGKMFVITDATGKTTFGVTHESGVRPGGEQDVFSVSNDVYSDDMHVYAKFAKVEKAGVEGNIYTIQLCKADGTNYSLWGSNGYLNFQPTGQNIVFALGLGDGEKYGQDAENCGLWDVQEVDGGVTIKNVGNGGYLNPCAASDASIAIAPSAEAVVCKLAKSFSKDGAEFVKDNTTAIAGIDAEANKVIFNLNGVRMNKTVNGINIINGKKVFIKK